MRVLLCKIQCPSFVCFCKPSPNLYASGSLKLEDTPPPQVSSVDDDADQYIDAQVEEVVDHREEECATEGDCGLEEIKEGQSNVEILKSSFKKEAIDPEDGERREKKKKKKKVQWVDLMGKELAEIREFESSEEEEIRYDGDRSCVCVIL
ncbi:hypothetical protein Rs2_20321 [Raphanus sativus]|nr:hypothetical protein Rs2_20321 [Raphanus sativus]